MNDPQAYTFPNSHYADMGALSPLVPDRVCELSVECCQLRNILSDKEDENDQLKSTVNRMKTAVKRGSGTLKFTVQQNKMLENEKTKLVTELMTVQKKLMQAESKVSFQSKVIENNRRMITKLKTPSDDGGHHGKNIAQILNEDAELRKKVGELSRDLEAARVEDEDKQRRLTKYEKDTAQLQKNICILHNKLTTVQADLRSEKATVSLMREKNQQEDMGELSYTNAFIDLEEAYEELHTKYEKLWADRDEVLHSKGKLQDERNFIYTAAKKAGIRIDSLLSERETELSEEETFE